jgi:cobalt-zinc-cadmium efflux system outer membrane protein
MRTNPHRVLYAVVLAALAAVPAVASAQRAVQLVSVRPVTRREAVDEAVDRGPRLILARADTLLATAQLITARALQNPTLATTYSKSTPRYHAIVELPLDYPWLRRSRIGAAEASRVAARFRYRFASAAIALDADTTYTRALAAQAKAQLSRRTAADADSLRQMAVVRRDAGDASDLDVELAAVSAGQQANLAAADSLDLLTTLLDLQIVMGLSADSVAIALADSLIAPPPDSLTATGTPLNVAAAERSLAAASLGVRAQRRSVFGAPAVQAGIETGDPSGSEPGILPTFGVSLPLPLFNRNRGPIAEAAAERERAVAELRVTRLENQAQIARALRQRTVALAKLERDRQLVASAGRVAVMSLTAYREGAAALPNVIEARRSAREVLAQYIDDLASALIAASVARLFTLTAATP